jgi:hypothetical protein
VVASDIPPTSTVSSVDVNIQSQRNAQVISARIFQQCVCRSTALASESRWRCRVCASNRARTAKGDMGQRVVGSVGTVYRKQRSRRCGSCGHYGLPKAKGLNTGKADDKNEATPRMPPLMPSQASALLLKPVTPLRTRSCGSPLIIRGVIGWRRTIY